MATRWTLNPPMGQVIGGWFGAMIVLGIAGGWLFGPPEVTLHTVPGTPPVSASKPVPTPTEAHGATVPTRELTGTTGRGKRRAAERAGQAGTSCSARIAGLSHTPRSTESMMASTCSTCASSEPRRWTSASPHISSSTMRRPSPRDSNCTS
jgi:hypothetical protein